jgi:hypothetical protein
MAAHVEAIQMPDDAFTAPSMLAELPLLHDVPDGRARAHGRVARLEALTPWDDGMGGDRRPRG